MEQCNNLVIILIIASAHCPLPSLLRPEKPGSAPYATTKTISLGCPSISWIHQVCSELTRWLHTSHLSKVWCRRVAQPLIVWQGLRRLAVSAANPNAASPKISAAPRFCLAVLGSRCHPNLRILDSHSLQRTSRDVPYQSLIKVWLQEKLHSH